MDLPIVTADGTKLTGHDTPELTYLVIKNGAHAVDTAPNSVPKAAA